MPRTSTENSQITYVKKVHNIGHRLAVAITIKTTRMSFVNDSPDFFFLSKNSFHRKTVVGYAQFGLLFSSGKTYSKI